MTRRPRLAMACLLLLLVLSGASGAFAATAPRGTVTPTATSPPNVQNRIPFSENAAAHASSPYAPSIDPTVSVSTVSPSVPFTATASSPERKVFFADDNWWIFWDDSGSFTYSSSADGATWSASVQPAGFSSELSFNVWFSGTTVYYAASNGVEGTGGTGDFYYATGTLSSGGTISWTAETTVSTQYPTQDSISGTTDSLGNPWVTVYTEKGGVGVGDQYVEVYELTGGTWTLAQTVLGGSIGPEFGPGWVQIVPLPQESPTVPSVAILYSFYDCTGCFTGAWIKWTTGLSGGVWSWSSAFNIGYFEETQVSYAQFSSTAIGDTVYTAASAVSGGIYFSSYVIGETDSASAPVMIASGFSWFTATPTEVSISQGAAGSNTLAIFYNDDPAGPNVDYSVSADLGATGTWSQSQSIFSSPQTEVTAISSADSASPSGEFGLVFINYEGIFNLDFASVTIGSTSTQVTASLQDIMGVTDTPVVPATTSLSDLVKVGDAYVAPMDATLTDAVNVVDTYVQTIMAPLNDIVGLGESLMASLGLPIVRPATIIFHDPPGNILITTPDGAEVGCDAGGSTVNQIPTLATVSGCSPSEETVTISNPSSGEYRIQIFGTGTGPLTVTVETFDSTRNPIDTASYNTSVTGGSSQTIYADLAANGQVTISNSPPLFGVPEFPSSLILVVVAALFLSLAFWRMRKPRFRFGHEATEDAPKASHPRFP